MINRLKHTLRKWGDPTRRALSSAHVIHQVLKKQRIPRLRGEKLFIVTDSSEKHGHIFDALICTDEYGLEQWNQQRQRVRQEYPSMPMLHYKKLKRDTFDWRAMQAYLNAMNAINGITAVIATPDLWIATDTEHLRAAKALGADQRNHPWRVDRTYVGLVNLASLVAAMARPLVRRGMSVGWLSDTEPPLRNKPMRQDIENAFRRALDITIPQRLKDCELVVKEDLPNTNNWKMDCFAMPDMLAGGVGDAIDALIEQPHDELVSWDPRDRLDLRKRESLVADWFWGQGPIGPVRIGVRLEERGFDGKRLHRRANWFRPPNQP
jgi:hypothetical protein